MKKNKLFDAEYKFMDIVWELEPINSTQLVKVCLEKLAWNKSTTYTVLRKLAQREIVKNENTFVVALVKREDMQKYECNELVEKSFNGSLPAFITAFLNDKTLSLKDAEEIKKMIEEATR
ncbi:BlaI/MecI/CopY family transcriptional regulator [Alkalibaculum sp. M08DMB]|uniref:BlaI/MecI/CopY family transcriptional regulator n=1 Tax=Alkalibaculum sporogenes TaxID=2655001 RepID=A0A6A7K8J9_9FIRM|nr:BlaI/MecI/CopY family transcriptional regulator [Alkalibaculum sporogenes]MPW25798.1 BlaI/MecI/CopY family transcriptional regulator [Alkalibaculum sporogenes]